MVVVILARERSERFPLKHLALINGVPMIEAMIRRLTEHGARVILATGPHESNSKIGRAAQASGATVHYEEAAPEWDIPTRMVDMADSIGVDRWVQLSGDCVFFDMRAVELLWNRVSETRDHKVVLVPAYAATAVGIGDRMVSAETVNYWRILDARMSRADSRREQAWVHVDPSAYRVERVEVPWTDLTKTPIKTSIDWPMEAAIADHIVRHLGRWPETDKDIEQVYRETTSFECPPLAGENTFSQGEDV